MFGCDLHVCYSNRKGLTLACLWLLLALGMAFSITSFDSIGKCYTVPCVSTMSEVLKVNNGLSLTLLMTGFLFILQPVYGIWFMRVRCSQLVGGAYIGAIFEQCCCHAIISKALELLFPLLVVRGGAKKPLIDLVLVAVRAPPTCTRPSTTGGASRATPATCWTAPTRWPCATSPGWSGSTASRSTCTG